MPSTLELIRLNNYIQNLTPEARKQFFTNQVTFMETVERDTVKPNELSAFNEFVEELKSASAIQEPYSVWAHELFRKNRNNTYFIRFLNKIPQK
jgi:hypothetical protein